MVIIGKQPKRDISYPKYVFLAEVRMKNLENQEEFLQIDIIANVPLEYLNIWLLIKNFCVVT